MIEARIDIEVLSWVIVEGMLIPVVTQMWRKCRSLGLADTMLSVGRRSAQSSEIPFAGKVSPFLASSGKSIYFDLV